ncbi:MAG: lipoate--protein ligase family protein, partial [Clostridia bacterium]|nr:lipoate--protein ligase family protein [Clostridia bacterium]
MKTLLIDLETTSPQFNLAAEEYFLKKDECDKLILWQNEPSIIIGRNQNTLAEINKDIAESLGIHVVRRMSGGGAVFHDLGNLNYTFITKNDGNDFLNFKKFTDPVIDVLGSLGVTASLSGRNDLLIDGRKFSGNAQYVHKDMLLHHGTLMFRSDISVLEKV